MITDEEISIETVDKPIDYKDLTNITNKYLIHGDSIKIQGFVEIKNGDTHIKGKNKFTQSILKHIMNFLSCANNTSYVNMALGSFSYTMYIGTDTTIPTAYNTTVLTSPIGTSPGTGPNILSGSSTNPSTGIFKVIITATWNAGTVSGTVGEMALYLNTFDSLQGFGWNGQQTQTGNRLASRLSVANGDFTAFAINPSNPLIISWTIQLSF
jgi:hypothetical protein